MGTRNWKTRGTARIELAVAALLTSTAASAATVVVYDFEGGSTEAWIGQSTAGGPWSVTEWASHATSSLKADVDLQGGQRYSLLLARPQNLDGKISLSAVARRSTWGNFGDGLKARLFVKSGSGWQYQMGPERDVTAATSGTVLQLNLATVQALFDVKELGVEFFAGSGSTGKGSIYVDAVSFSTDASAVERIAWAKEGTPQIDSEHNPYLSVGQSLSRLDAKTGSAVWTYQAPRDFSFDARFPFLAFLRSDIETTAIDKANGRALWSRPGSDLFEVAVVTRTMVCGYENGSSGSKVVCMRRSDGATTWQSEPSYGLHLDAQDDSTMVVASVGMAKVMLVDVENNRLRWQTSIDQQYPYVDSATDGCVFAQKNHSLVAMRKTDSTALWQYSFQSDYITSSVAGNMLFVADNKLVIIFDKRSGKQLRAIPGDSMVVYPTPNGSAIVRTSFYNSSPSHTYSISSEGSIQWQKQTDLWPTLDTNNNLYFNDAKTVSLANQSNGTVQWIYRLDNMPRNQGLVVGQLFSVGDSVYFTAGIYAQKYTVFNKLYRAGLSTGQVSEVADLGDYSVSKLDANAEGLLVLSYTGYPPTQYRIQALRR